MYICIYVYIYTSSIYILQVYIYVYIYVHIHIYIHSIKRWELPDMSNIFKNINVTINEVYTAIISIMTIIMKYENKYHI
jgi:hypothetical protein